MKVNLQPLCKAISLYPMRKFSHRFAACESILQPVEYSNLIVFAPNFALSHTYAFRTFAPPLLKGANAKARKEKPVSAIGVFESNPGPPIDIEREGMGMQAALLPLEAMDDKY